MCSEVECVLPPYIPSLGNYNLGRSDMIKRYCELGFKEIQRLNNALSPSILVMEYN